MDRIHKRPEWIDNYNKPIGTEIKFINGHWYLYERKSVWDSKKGRAKKKSGKMIGTITQSGLILKQEKNKHRELSCYEFGASYFIYKVSYSLIKDLTSHLNKKGLLLYCISTLIIKDNIELNDVSEYYKQSYLKILEGRISFNKESIKEALNLFLLDSYLIQDFAKPSFDDYYKTLQKDNSFEFNKEFLEIDNDKVLAVLYYLISVINNTIESYLIENNISITRKEIISLLRTYHIFRENRKYIKAKPLKSVQKIMEKLDFSFDL